MSEEILEKMQEINALLWVLDLDKAEPILADLKMISKQLKDPFFKKKIKKYMESYQEISSQLSQSEINFSKNERSESFIGEEEGYFVFSDEFTSSLFILKSRFELEIRMVVTTEGKLQYHPIEEILIPKDLIEFRSDLKEKSRMSSVYNISFGEEASKFGEIAFTRSGLGIGRLFFNQFSSTYERSVYIDSVLRIVLNEMVNKIYKTI